MVCSEPELSDVFPFFVYSNFTCFDMTMIIYYGHDLSIVFIKNFCYVIFKKKIIIHKIKAAYGGEFTGHIHVIIHLIIG